MGVVMDAMVLEEEDVEEDVEPAGNPDEVVAVGVPFGLCAFVGNGTYLSFWRTRVGSA